MSPYVKALNSQAKNWLVILQLFFIAYLFNWNTFPHFMKSVNNSGVFSVRGQKGFSLDHRINVPRINLESIYFHRRNIKLPRAYIYFFIMCDWKKWLKKYNINKRKQTVTLFFQVSFTSKGRGEGLAASLTH